VILRALVATTLVTLVTASAADAALCIRLSTQAPRPVVGDATIIEMKTFVPLVSGGLKPWVVRGYPFRVEAVSPRGKAFRVTVKPSRNPYAWRGTFRFTSVGVWTVRVTNWGRYQTGCGEELHVRVRAR
jgi:hypothetical protein